MANIPSFTSCTHLKENTLCFQWKKASKTRGFFLVAATTTVMPCGNTLDLIEQEQNMETDGLGNWGSSYSEDEKEIEPKEAIRRMRISKANKGKVPWNKGRKHSPETLVRIKERTKQAMQNPQGDVMKEVGFVLGNSTIFSIAYYSMHRELDMKVTIHPCVELTFELADQTEAVSSTSLPSIIRKFSQSWKPFMISWKPVFGILKHPHPGKISGTPKEQMEISGKHFH
ncbi:hypothetical protein KI387_002101 [Taxus chinensis]|uniref:Nuclease associated modular domain-containing protein n=1 Tax=Taxus chinensis TaxID=29808 RepID=A0AA38GVY7_TAXCH|nr:hypothetical protein KI387_002101 [Taxus chinensis]